MQERTALFDDPQFGRFLQNDLADALRAMIQEFSFTSYKRLCTHFRLAKSTCLRILHDVFHLKKFSLRWVLHSLDDGQKAERVSLSTDFLMVFKKPKEWLYSGYNWRRIMVFFRLSSSISLAPVQR
jgi:hypothetical protein